MLNGAETVSSNDKTTKDNRQPPADCLEPVRFEWTVTGYEVRCVLKRYSEYALADP